MRDNGVVPALIVGLVLAILVNVLFGPAIYYTVFPLVVVAFLLVRVQRWLRNLN